MSSEFAYATCEPVSDGAELLGAAGVVDKQAYLEVGRFAELAVSLRPTRQNAYMPSRIKFSGAEKDMTLDELEDAIRHARNVGAKGDRCVYAILSTSGKIKEIGLDIGEEPED
ncbi:hypothetical protein [Streptomyces sp. NPDC101150]|uniref:hypothetical protein n=1 Tax=Streptomyces sp. NPDC101150 TaxID=3366114 RepID=UPI003803B0DE